MAIAESLKKFRREKGLTQKQAAEKIGISSEAFSQYEKPFKRGEPVTPKIDVVIKLAKAFNVSLDYLAGLTDNPDPNWVKVNGQGENEKSASTNENDSAKNSAEFVRRKEFDSLQAEIEDLKLRVDSIEEETLSDVELKIFNEEIAKMQATGKTIDIRKAIRNAKYLAKIEKRMENIDSGKNLIKFTDEEWEKFINE